jgi:hypothetical protein
MDVGGSWATGCRESFLEDGELGAAARLGGAHLDGKTELNAEGTEYAEKR